MAKEKYTPPKYQGNAFHCPHCGVYAHQRWSNPGTQVHFKDGMTALGNFGMCLSMCHSCEEAALWVVESKSALHVTGKLVYPVIQDAPPPNPDMSADVQECYKEAAAIKRESPRAAAALLRLALEQMCVDAGAKGKTLQLKIDSLVEAGLPRRLIESMDTVRVLGNDAVHPGTIKKDEEEGTVASLFLLVNFIADKLITEKREIDAINAAVPDSKKRKNLPPKEGEGG